MRSVEACPPADFAFRILNFFTGSASSEIAHPNSGRAVRPRPADNTVSAPRAPSPHIREPGLARRFRLRPPGADVPVAVPAPAGQKTCERRFLHRAADLLRQFRARPSKPLSFRRYAYKTPAWAKLLSGCAERPEVTLLDSVFWRLKIKAPRPQQGAFRTSSSLV